MRDNTAAINEIIGLLGDKQRKAYVRSFGCQLNVSDGEKIKGLLMKMGYSFTEDEHEADLIILNTCAVRESAEDRVFGIVGSMKKLKELKPSLILGTSAISALPELLLKALHGAKFSADISEYDDFSEAAEQVRESSFKASVPIMFGCNNFCTYCIVPHVRGRERSRRPEDIISEVSRLVHSGYKEIMLLGQNVNSYGRDLEGCISFPQLLRELDAIEGDFWIRFMSSHPKDASKELIDAIFECGKVAKHLHLPVQSGSSDVLRRMNRHYDIEKYLSIVRDIYSRDPDFSLTTDLIVGFPDESGEDFGRTLDLIREVRYDNIYSFIYSKRSGTPAAVMADSISDEEKGRRMRELLEVQREVSTEHYKRFVGRTMRVLADDVSKKRQGWLTGKSSEFIIVEFEGDSSLIGQFVDVEITGSMNWAVTGKLKKG